jgi:hypothetical protein
MEKFRQLDLVIFILLFMSMMGSLGPLVYKQFREPTTPVNVEITPVTIEVEQKFPVTVVNKVVTYDKQGNVAYRPTSNEPTFAQMTWSNPCGDYYRVQGEVWFKYTSFDENWNNVCSKGNTVQISTDEDCIKLSPGSYRVDLSVQMSSSFHSTLTAAIGVDGGIVESSEGNLYCSPNCIGKVSSSCLLEIPKYKSGLEVYIKSNGNDEVTVNSCTLMVHKLN